ncbi:Rho-associated, coiled-coil containing protein kinase [Trachipleistophora hominis]|uniref:non-specific serine/threonine protein kinase n=1 Tax=Trachipleistophora hominis TaxID=72359 RepID=L7K0L8_TRAHO|nr:Rho-associated, coiled-coil containing protein kinase [Trachipleistophora hominis]
MTQEERQHTKIDLNYLLDCAELVGYSRNVPSEIAQLCRSRINLHNFALIRGIAKGGYGSVYLVQSNQSQQYYALKVIKKQVVIDMPHLALFENEKAALKSARDAQYLVFMHCSFQNERSIFFLMDFYPCELLERVPVHDEQELRFYAAGVLLAIEELHKLGYVHRDIKPENIFLDSAGYVKLADFGSCCRIKDAKGCINENEAMRSTCSRKFTGGSARSSGSTGSATRSEIMVGTPDYIAPECFTNEQGVEVDMWAYGVVLYELKKDETPFYAATLTETQSNIREIKYEKCAGVFGDLIDRLLQYKHERINVQQCKEHPFFEGVSFGEYAGGLRPPFVPEVSTEKEAVHLEDEEIEHTCDFVGFGYDPSFDGFEVCMGCRTVAGMVDEHHGTMECGEETHFKNDVVDRRTCPKAVVDRMACITNDEIDRNKRIENAASNHNKYVENAVHRKINHELYDKSKESHSAQANTTDSACNQNMHGMPTKRLTCTSCGKTEEVVEKEPFTGVYMQSKNSTGTTNEDVPEQAIRTGTVDKYEHVNNALAYDALVKRCTALVNENNTLKQRTRMIDTVLNTLRSVDLNAYHEKVRNMMEKFRTLDAFKTKYKTLISTNQRLVKYKEECEDLKIRNGVLTNIVKREQLERMSRNSCECCSNGCNVGEEKDSHRDSGCNSKDSSGDRDGDSNRDNKISNKDNKISNKDSSNTTPTTDTTNTTNTINPTNANTINPINANTINPINANAINPTNANTINSSRIFSFNTGCKQGIEVDSVSKRKAANERLHRARDEGVGDEHSLEKKLPKCSQLKDNVLIKTERMIELESELERMQRNNNELKGRIARMSDDKARYKRRIALMKDKMVDYNYYVNTVVNNVKITLHEIDIVSLYRRMNRDIRTLSKMLKIREQEKKEVELMNTTEVTIRKKLEKEILRYKAEIKRLRAKGEINIVFKVRVEGEKALLRIEKNQLYLLDIVENLCNCVCANLSKAEKLRYKRKNVVKLVFIEEGTPSVVHTRSRSQLLEDLRKEKRLYASIEKLSTMHTGKVLEKARTQLEGSLRKIKYLEAEIENADDSDAQHESTSREDVLFYDGHVFVRKKGLSGYCNFCDEPHYSISLSCEQCGITVHRQCYMLAMSCDMCKSVKKGRSFMVEMKNFEEVERLVKILKKDV